MRNGTGAAEGEGDQSYDCLTHLNMPVMLILNLSKQPPL